MSITSPCRHMENKDVCLTISHYTVGKSQVGHFSLEVKFKANVMEIIDVTCFT